MTTVNQNGAPDASHDQGQPAPTPQLQSKPEKPAAEVREYGGPKGLEPTRYGDWEKKGRCIDF